MSSESRFRCRPGKRFAKYTKRASLEARRTRFLLLVVALLSLVPATFLAVCASLGGALGLRHRGRLVSRARRGGRLIVPACRSVTLSRARAEEKDVRSDLDGLLEVLQVVREKAHGLHVVQQSDLARLPAFLAAALGLHDEGQRTRPSQSKYIQIRLHSRSHGRSREEETEGVPSGGETHRWCRSVRRRPQTEGPRAATCPGGRCTSHQPHESCNRTRSHREITFTGERNSGGAGRGGGWWWGGTCRRDPCPCAGTAKACVRPSQAPRGPSVRPSRPGPALLRKIQCLRSDLMNA